LVRCCSPTIERGVCADNIRAQSRLSTQLSCGAAEVAGSGHEPPTPTPLDNGAGATLGFFTKR
jgi:hypothetical protein